MPEFSQFAGLAVCILALTPLGLAGLAWLRESPPAPSSGEE